MTLIVETGANVTNSNTYISITELIAYSIARGVTLTTDAEQLIIKSMDYVDSLSFIGFKANEDQSLQWPRSGVEIDGYIVDSDEIPQLLKDSLMVTCLELEAGNDQLSTIDRETSSESIGDISVTYKNGTSATVISRTISAKLQKLLSDTGGIRLSR